MNNITILFMERMIAISASVSAFLFSFRDTSLVIHSSSFFRHSPLMAKYRAIHSSFASYSYWIYLIISWESLLISNLVAANIRVRSSLANTTSYSVSLLEVGKLRRIVCSTSSPVGDCRTRPTSNPDTLDAPSTWIVHHCSLGWLIGCVCF